MTFLSFLSFLKSFLRLKVKLLPKCNLGFFLWMWVKPSCKSIIMTKEALSRFATIFKTLRRLDTTWNFACGITRVSTHEHEHWEHCLIDHKLLLSLFSKLCVHKQLPLSGSTCWCFSFTYCVPKTLRTKLWILCTITASVHYVYTL